VFAQGKPIDTKTGMLILLSVGALLVAGVWNLHSAEEIVGQYFFQFGIGEVNGDFSKPERRYTIKGRYAFGHDFNTKPPFDPAKRKLDASFDWVAEGRYNPVTNATSEKLDLFNTNTRASAGSLNSTMVCNRDPWLEPSVGPCQFVVTTPSGSPAGTFVLDISPVAPSLPFSSALTTTERWRLNRQFDIFLAARPKFEALLTPTHESTAPSIVAPAQNGYMVYRKSKFIIQPAPNFSGTGILVEFTPPDTPAGQPPEKIYWPMSTNALSQGADIPYNIFGTREGTWTMRARTNVPVPGAFTREVRFQYLLQNPFVNLPSEAPVERQGGK
jgi:hypothetical protein